MSCLFCVLKIAEIENLGPVPSESFSPFQTSNRKCQQVEPQLCLPHESSGEIMIQVDEVVIILCSNRPSRIVKNKSYDPQAGSHRLEDLQVCLLRFTSNIKV